MTLRVDGAEAVQRLRTRIAEAKARLDNLGPALAPAAAQLNTMIVRGFNLQRGPNEEPWPPLRPTTVARRRNKGNPKMLQDTGNLKRSISTRATDQSVLFGVSGSAATYARTHQFGNPSNRMFGKAKAPIPARPFLPVAKDGSPKFERGPARKWFVDKFVARITRYITEGKV